MKTNLFFILFLFTLSLLIFLPHTATADITKWGLPDGAVTRLGKGAITGGLDYSPDGTRLAVSSSTGIWIYDTHSWKELTLITGHTRGVSSVSFSPDGQTIASASQDGTVLLWRVMLTDASTFQLNADVNGDGAVNIQDLVSVAAKLGQTGTSRADVNGDGVVNIQDLVLIAGALES